jgi:hypothetical protein
VAGRLGLCLVDEELDLLDLALQRSGFVGEARGELRGGSDLRVGLRFPRTRRAVRARRPGVGGVGGCFRGDLSPPAS